MKLRLLWKSQYAVAVNFPDRNTINALDLVQTGAMNRFQLRFQIRHRPAGRNKKITIESFEIAFDLVRRHDLFDPIDRGSVTLRVKPGTFCTEHFFHFGVALIERIDEMGGGSSGHAATDRTVIDERNMSIFTRKQIGGRHAGDSRADNAYVGCDIFR